MEDRFGRTINYLRVSLTDKCNLRCQYCMPENMVFRPDKTLLQDDELRRLITLFTSLGVTKIRFTGGEPTLRKGFVDIIRHTAQTAGVQHVAMTTNGVLLSKLARPLADAGLQRVNISIDTLDADKFRKLTRWGNLSDVWRGIEAAEAAGLEVKLNAVVVRGFNDKADIVALAKLTQTHPWQVRYIEMMPFGDTADFQQAGVVPESELRATIAAELGPLTLLNNGTLDGEARLYKLNDAPGTLGFISSVTQPFCAGCNRARLTADGKLRLCLLREKEFDLRTPLRNHATDYDLAQQIRQAIWWKPWGHGLSENIVPLNRIMSDIGG